MARVNKLRALKRLATATSMGLSMMLPLTGALAQTSPTAPASASQSQEPSTNAMVNLIRLLVKQGTITPANGDALIAQAIGEAETARKTVEQASGSAGIAPPALGAVRVPYVPESVRKKIAEDVRAEVMAKAKEEGWAAPANAAPDWTRRITISGDVRVRSQSNLYSKLNDNTLLDYAAINATPGGFDFIRDLGNNLPYLNTRQDRVNQMQVRARLGIKAAITDQVEAGLRFATGNDNSPISTNEALGGGLAKRDLWLDRAYVKLRPIAGSELALGRFENPFRSTPLLFDEDLNFDGVAASLDVGKLTGSKDFGLVLRGGAFPLDQGSGNFPQNSQTKSSYPSRWLLSGQIEGKVTVGSGIEGTVAAAYHSFGRMQGQLSAPCLFSGANIPLADGANDPDECSTDGTRATFARKGNTLFFIRDIRVPAGETQLASQRQFLGRVYNYRVLDLNVGLSFPLGEDKKVWLAGNYLRNLGFKRSDECRFGTANPPFTNVILNNGNGNVCSATNPATVSSGNEGWLASVTAGTMRPRRWGEWQIAAAYRYLQTDAVVDSYTDSNFHLGGTNAKGYVLSGSLGLFDGIRVGTRWLSANEITGSPLSIDVLQFDLTAEF